MMWIQAPFLDLLSAQNIRYYRVPSDQPRHLPLLISPHDRVKAQEILLSFLKTQEFDLVFCPASTSRYAKLIPEWTFHGLHFAKKEGFFIQFRTATFWMGIPLIRSQDILTPLPASRLTLKTMALIFSEKLRLFWGSILGIGLQLIKPQGLFYGVPLQRFPAELSGWLVWIRQHEERGLLVKGYILPPYAFGIAYFRALWVFFTGGVVIRSLYFSKPTSSSKSQVFKLWLSRRGGVVYKRG